MTEEEKRRREQLAAAENAAPAEYQSAYGDAIAALESKLQGRSFSWNPEADELYRKYRDRYTRLGKLAMKDSVGQSAALTGGYGNSYAQAAGQQAYDAWLQKLNDAELELAEAAYGRYRDEGEDLTGALERLTEAEQEDYGRWQDRVNGWRKDREYAYQAAEDEKKAAAEAQRESYDNLYQAILHSGYVPEEQELAAANMTRAEAEALRLAYLNGLAGRSSGSTGGAGRGSGSGSSRQETEPENRYSAVLAELRALLSAGSSPDTLRGKISAAYSAGAITAQEREYLLREFG